MKKAELKLATLNHYQDGIVCPTCDYVQYLVDPDMTPGTYKCGDCYELFKIEQTLLDCFRRPGSEQDVDDRVDSMEDTIDGLERRIQRLERELGIK